MKWVSRHITAEGGRFEVMDCREGYCLYVISAPDIWQEFIHAERGGAFQQAHDDFGVAYESWTNLEEERWYLHKDGKRYEIRHDPFEYHALYAQADAGGMAAEDWYETRDMAQDAAARKFGLSRSGWVKEEVPERIWISVYEHPKRMQFDIEWSSQMVLLDTGAVMNEFTMTAYPAKDDDSEGYHTHQDTLEAAQDMAWEDFGVPLDSWIRAKEQKWVKQHGGMTAEIVQERVQSYRLWMIDAAQGDISEELFNSLDDAKAATVKKFGFPLGGWERRIEPLPAPAA